MEQACCTSGAVSLPGWLPSGKYLFHLDWYVHSIRGDDRSDGMSPATALKTLAALNALLDGAVFTAEKLTVHLAGEFGDEDLMFDITRILPNGLVEFCGDADADGVFVRHWEGC